ncbi:MAG: DUF1707 and DUF2154 domain-containing protein [Kutzneria sp.]|nr:DUF1707 and DUF2154 domain-containing protein [Kutzneria sp.]MBV9847411.1 DUF1707 and DUF2154 domain-containing protein [Kutzneria sp.]
MRASDADRERVARVLHDAMTEGRLTAGELDERLAGLYRAKTFGELEPFVKDLPAAEVTPLSDTRISRVGGDPGPSSTAIAIMSEVRRVGDWVVPAHYTVTAFWGSARLDLREAQFHQRECVIAVTAIMAGVDIIVPPELTVRIDGIGVMGEFKRDAEADGTPGSPSLRITGLALMAGVNVKRKRRKGDGRQIAM